MLAHDYPAEALRLRQEGDVTLAMCVSAAGAVSNVRVAVSSGVPVLDEATVHAVSGMTFSPARNAAGQPVAWCDPPYQMTVQWRLPPEMPASGEPPVVNGITLPTFDEAALGRIINIEHGAHPALDDLEGETSITACISAAGRAYNVRLERSSGNAEIDAATLRVAAAIQYTPARDRAGRAVDYCETPFYFSLGWTRRPR